MIRSLTRQSTDSAEPSPGRIFTFYSYKGGTGRSMALANVAWILAMNGRRVLVIDWDFEAPGLHRYYWPFLPDPEMTETPGLIDFFVHFCEAARLEGRQPTETNSEGDPWFYDRTDLMRYSVPLDYEFPEGGVLDFIGAGQQGPTYGVRVNTFQWGSFYKEMGGGVFLEAVKSRLREDYDFVLIDSRTGLSDTSGICTVHMPDELVVCFTLNRQSTLGAAATATSADTQRRTPNGVPSIRVWPVPMRIELAEKERLEAGRLFAREKFAPFLWHIPPAIRPEYWGSVEVLYFPYYAYEEILDRGRYAEKLGLAPEFARAPHRASHGGRHNRDADVERYGALRIACTLSARTIENGSPKKRCPPNLHQLRQSGRIFADRAEAGAWNRGAIWRRFGLLG